MGINLEISEILNRFKLNEREKSNLARLFDFTNYLLDDESNLTKTLNLVKKAREQLIERIQELFEGNLMEQEDSLELEIEEDVK
ncbi:MAG: hypothetical protein ACTSPS_00400 [Promethearchaeota archaeon]